MARTEDTLPYPCNNQREQNNPSSQKYCFYVKKQTKPLHSRHLKSGRNHHKRKAQQLKGLKRGWSPTVTHLKALKSGSRQSLEDSTCRGLSLDAGKYGGKAMEAVQDTSSSLPAQSGGKQGDCSACERREGRGTPSVPGEWERGDKASPVGATKPCQKRKG